MTERQRSDSNLIDVGYIARPHGVRGEVRVVTYDPESTTLAEVDEVHIAGKRYEIVAARPVQGAYLLSLAGLRDRNQVEPMRGQVVAVARELIPLEDGEVFLADLVGCLVVLPDGTEWGTIAGIDMGPQERLIIHHGDIERLLPMVPDFIAEIDLDASRVVVAPPEGLPETRRNEP